MSTVRLNPAYSFNAMANTLTVVGYCRSGAVSPVAVVSCTACQTNNDTIVPPSSLTMSSGSANPNPNGDVFTAVFPVVAGQTYAVDAVLQSGPLVLAEDSAFYPAAISTSRRTGEGKGKGKNGKGKGKGVKKKK
jgi:hypothetical protein